MHYHQHYNKRAEDKTETVTMPQSTGTMAESSIQVTPWLEEWDYGEYEGLTLGDVKRQREEQGLPGDEWNIWRDGCPGGE